MAKGLTRARVVKVDMSEPVRDLRKLAKDNTLGIFAATEAMRLMDPYVPYRDGYLSGSAVAEPWKVRYVAPYAAYVYAGRRMRFSKEKHPLATSYWDRPLSQDSSELASLIEAKIRSM